MISRNSLLQRRPSESESKNSNALNGRRGNTSTATIGARGPRSVSIEMTKKSDTARKMATAIEAGIAIKAEIETAAGTTDAVKTKQARMDTGISDLGIFQTTSRRTTNSVTAISDGIVTVRMMRTLDSSSLRTPRKSSRCRTRRCLGTRGKSWSVILG